jgi:hypothetical protein
MILILHQPLLITKVLLLQVATFQINSVVFIINVYIIYTDIFNGFQQAQPAAASVAPIDLLSVFTTPSISSETLNVSNATNSITSNVSTQSSSASDNSPFSFEVLQPIVNNSQTQTATNMPTAFNGLNNFPNGLNNVSNSNWRGGNTFANNAAANVSTGFMMGGSAAPNMNARTNYHNTNPSINPNTGLSSFGMAPGSTMNNTMSSGFNMQNSVMNPNTGLNGFGMAPGYTMNNTMSSGFSMQNTSGFNSLQPVNRPMMGLGSNGALNSSLAISGMNNSRSNMSIMTNPCSGFPTFILYAVSFLNYY